MARRNTLTDAGVKALKPKAKAYVFPDPECRGHYVRVLPSGAKSFVVIARDKNGKQVWETVGAVGVFKIEEARDTARDKIKAIKAGRDTAGPQSFKAVSDDWFKRHVEAKGLRTASEIRRTLDNQLLPAWAARDFAGIRRGDVAKLLDQIEDGSGPIAANKALATVSRICNWHATRKDDYGSPIVKGMKRPETKRERILTDDELRAVWKAAAANGTFGALVRLLLLTGQRLDKVASMKWADVSVDGVWTIPTEAREKGNALEMVLPTAALDIIKAQPRFASNPYVLASGRGKGHYKGYSNGKASFDKKVKADPWTLHDLRRTARSLMSRAGVLSDHGERTIGHKIKGVAAIYDRHSYREEKAHALKQLAALIERIVNPPTKNVVSIAG